MNDLVKKYDATPLRVCAFVEYFLPSQQAKAQAVRS
jgi:hypothetical protein